MILYKLALIHRKLFNLIFPRHCADCGKAETYLCEKCLREIDTAEMRENDNFRAVFNYRDKVLKRAVWQLKYHGAKEIAVTFGKVIYEKLIEELSNLEVWSGKNEKFLVIPVPLSSRRERRRSFNQSALIARAFANCDLNTFEVLENNLIKIKETPTQVSLKDRDERLKNLRGAFTIQNPKQIKNRHIILIDDVTTTGATLSECRKVLRATGAKSVIALAVAGG